MADGTWVMAWDSVRKGAAIVRGATFPFTREEISISGLAGRAGVTRG